MIEIDRLSRPGTVRDREPEQLSRDYRERRKKNSVTERFDRVRIEDIEKVEECWRKFLDCRENNSTIQLRCQMNQDCIANTGKLHIRSERILIHNHRKKTGKYQIDIYQASIADKSTTLRKKKMIQKRMDCRRMLQTSIEKFQLCRPNRRIAERLAEIARGYMQSKTMIRYY